MRLAVLILGKYGITAEQVSAMSRPELDGYLNALQRYHAPRPVGKRDHTTTTVEHKTYKSLRKKRG